ncbi:MAG: M64 family metallopeptidase [Burkholderiales bacterium]
MPADSRRRGFLKAAAATGASLYLPACGQGAKPEAPQTGGNDFADRALRIDLLHASREGNESFQLVNAHLESVWAGPRTRLAEDLGWGDYRFSLYDSADQALLFRYGFDSSVPVASSAANRVAVRLPLPLRRCEAVVEKRRGESAFHPIWRHPIEPGSREIDRATPSIETRIEKLLGNGVPQAKVDIAILGDGYTHAEHAKFVSDARRAADYLFAVEPFRRRVADFNVNAVFSASADSGVTDPYSGAVKDTVLKCAYGSGSSERTLASGDVRRVSEAASTVPYDFALVLANSRRYGGSAYFGGPAVVAADSAFARYLVMHEFGHVIGGLAEEYYVPAQDGPTYSSNIEPWHPNVTISSRQPKWLKHLAAGTALPTSWNKGEYENWFGDYVKRYSRLREAGAPETAIERLMNEAALRQRALLSRNVAARRVGAFEGAHGYSRRIYRAEADCIMFSLRGDYFCAACTAAIDRAIDYHTA